MHDDNSALCFRIVRMIVIFKRLIPPSLPSPSAVINLLKSDQSAVFSYVMLHDQVARSSLCFSAERADRMHQVAFEGL